MHQRAGASSGGWRWSGGCFKYMGPDHLVGAFIDLCYLVLYLFKPFRGMTIPQLTDIDWFIKEGV